MKRLITFCGPMGSGKSTAIKELKKFRENIGPVILIKFAEPLYDIQEYIYDRISPVYERPLNFVKDRFLLQLLGTDWGRNKISKSLWGDLWQRKVNESLYSYECPEVGKVAVNPNNIVVCDDVRFDNEAKRIKDMGGIIIKLQTTKNLERIDTNTGVQNHASEAGIDDKYVDYTIVNDGTLDEFKQKLHDLYKNLLDDNT